MLSPKTVHELLNYAGKPDFKGFTRRVLNRMRGTTLHNYTITDEIPPMVDRKIIALLDELETIQATQANDYMKAASKSRTINFKIYHLIKSK